MSKKEPIQPSERVNPVRFAVLGQTGPQIIPLKQPCTIISYDKKESDGEFINIRLPEKQPHAES